MINFADISHHQYDAGLRLSQIAGELDGLAVKATEGTSYVDPACDIYYQDAKRRGLLRAFYHFNGKGDAVKEADYFIENTRNYFGEGIPVLDWEEIKLPGNKTYLQPVSWVNSFVRRVHEITGVWAWIYANPWKFNQGCVEPNCMRWLAQYPAVTSPTFEQAGGWDCPTADGIVGAWQFCSDGRLKGYYPLDLDLFYGDESAWDAYAKGDSKVPVPETGKSYILEGDGIRVTVELD